MLLPKRAQAFRRPDTCHQSAQSNLADSLAGLCPGPSSHRVAHPNLWSTCLRQRIGMLSPLSHLFQRNFHMDLPGHRNSAQRRRRTPFRELPDRPVFPPHRYILGVFLVCRSGKQPAVVLLAMWGAGLAGVCCRPVGRRPR